MTQSVLLVVFGRLPGPLPSSTWLDRSGIKGKGKQNKKEKKTMMTALADMALASVRRSTAPPLEGTPPSFRCGNLFICDSLQADCISSWLHTYHLSRRLSKGRQSGMREIHRLRKRTGFDRCPRFLPPSFPSSPHDDMLGPFGWWWKIVRYDNMTRENNLRIPHAV